MNNSAKFITILGPTASGKTTMAIQLAQNYNGEIICADSRTIYKGMDIGTAKPTKEEQKVVKHHMLDICEPNRVFSSAEFKVMAQKTILDIQQRDKTAFLVGGSGMYIDAVLFDYKFRNDKSSVSIGRLSQYPLEKLQSAAQKKFPKDYEKIDNKNRRRLIQLITKGPSKDEDRNNDISSKLVLGIDQNRLILKQNIEVRTKLILKQNFIQEVRELRDKYGETEVLRQTTGYSEVLDYLNGKIKNKDDLFGAIVNSTWQLSRKQMSWFRRNKHIVWIYNLGQATNLIEQYL